ncbi:MAG: DNA-processing protein DprA [Alphaproteobacteria bacterium]|nr:DNA-processing protein DprA [Alphaproteobacteria bacterium]
MSDTTISQPERLARLRLIRSDSVGPVTFWAAIERFGSAYAAIDALPALSRKSGKARPITIISTLEAQKELEALSDFGAQLLTPGDNAYPATLAALDQPPPLITVKGDAQILNRDAIAIVGARNASALGHRFARGIARDLGEAGFVITSGLARGIDTAAHKGSLETGTVAVMAGGINVIYPPENARLFDEIAAKGAIIAEMPFAFQPTAQHFPRRNRIISGLARGVLVVEATLNSGSLITARLAGEQGREVFAVPGSPLDPRARGTNSLLRQGAILTESAEDIFATLRPAEWQQPAPKSPESYTAQPLPGDDRLEAEILRHLGAAPIESDELVRLLGVTPAAVATALLDLEFAGLLTRHAGQKVSLAAAG